MSLFDKFFYQLEENDVAEAQSALFVLTLQDRIESEPKLSLQKNSSKCNDQFNSAEMGTLNCNSTNFQNIRQINMCEICVRLDQKTKKYGLKKPKIYIVG